MNAKSTKKYLLAKPGAVEDYPFGDDVAVFKVKGKMFATLVSHRPNEPNPKFHNCAQMNLKCNPDEALALRDIFDAVLPGYHMNKKHWNTIVLDKSIPEGEIQRMIDCSYDLVVKSLKRVDRLALELKYGEDALSS